MKKQNLLVLTGLVFLAIAAWLYFKPNRPESPTVPLSEEIIIQEEGMVKKNGEEIQPMTAEEIEKIREEINSVLAVGGEETELKTLLGSQAGGKAKRAFSDGKFYFKVDAFNLSLPEKGYYYQGWLRKGTDYLSIGRLELTSGGQGVVYYTASADRSNYSETVITLEPEDGDPQPAKAVLEGAF